MSYNIFQICNLLTGYPVDYGEEYFTSEDDANANLTEEGQVLCCVWCIIII